MKKEFLTKRIALVALTGLISSGILTGCQKNESINGNISISTESENQDKYFVSNLVLVRYNTEFQTCAKFAKLRERIGNTLYFDSVTNSEIEIVVTNFDSNEEKCIVIPKDRKECFVGGEVDHRAYCYFKENGNIEDMNVSYDAIVEVENELESVQRDSIEQSNAYIEDLIKYKQVIDANGNIQLTDELRGIAYREEDRIKRLYVYLESENDKEKIYRSITTPEISINVKFDEDENKKNYFIHNQSSVKSINEELRVIYDYPIIESIMGYKETLDLEEANYYSDNIEYVKTDYQEVEKLTYQVNDEEFTRIMKFRGELDNKVYYSSVTIDSPTICVIGTLDENRNITNYKLIFMPSYYGKSDKNIEFIEMNAIKGLTEISMETAEKLEKEYREELSQGRK